MKVSTHRCRQALNDEIRALNPNVRIPILKDGEFVLTESCAIHSKCAWALSRAL